MRDLGVFPFKKTLLSVSHELAPLESHGAAAALS